MLGTLTNTCPKVNCTHLLYIPDFEFVACKALTHIVIIHVDFVNFKSTNLRIAVRLGLTTDNTL